MTDTNDAPSWNEQIMAELRANDGVVSGPMAGVPLLILHTTGRKSGQVREVPLVYLGDDDRYLIFASKAGAPTHPHWYLNLLDHPEVTVEVGSEKFPARAEEVTGAQRDELYARQVAAMPQFGEYQEGNPRIIPVVALTRA